MPIVRKNKKIRKKRRFRRKKQCPFKVNPELCEQLSYKNVDLMSRFITDRGKILPRRITGVSAKWQRRLALEIKRGRQVALLPYTVQ